MLRRDRILTLLTICVACYGCSRRTDIEAPAAAVTVIRDANQHGMQPGFRNEVTNSIGMNLKWVPAGKFTMGSPVGELGHRNIEREHEVEITKGFYLGACEVAQDDYEAIMGNNPSHFKGPKLPVEQVTWEEAREFCRKLSAKEGREYRLPTEAEWEYACRAGTKTPFSFGSTISTNQANYCGDYVYGDGVKGANRDKTMPVGSFAANEFGLHDMHGNVFEWCEDWFGEDYYEKSPKLDPPGPSEGASRVMRGGCWYFRPDFCRSADRSWYVQSNRYDLLGFRVALQLR